MPEDDKLSAEEIDFWNDVEEQPNINVDLETLNESTNTEILYHSSKDTGEERQVEER